MPVHKDIEHRIEAATEPTAHPSEEMQVQYLDLRVDEISDDVGEVTGDEDDEDSNHHAREGEVFTHVPLALLSRSRLGYIGWGR